MTRLPRWVETGAFVLAMMAGCVNAVGLLGFSHQAVSHLSGTATLLGLAVADGLGPGTGHLCLILASFVAGAALSGAMINNTSLRLGRSYGIALLLEAGLLLAAMLLLNADNSAGMYLASAACGLQNALATTYSGAIIRTTHMTGVFTDLGIMIGEMLRGRGFDRRRAMLYLLLLIGFVSGGSIGAAAFAQWQFSALLLPATLAAVLAVGYGVYRLRTAA